MRRIDSQVAVRRVGEIDGLQVTSAEPLARHTTLRVGGPAEVFVRVETEGALMELLDFVRQAGLEFHLLGLGSNLLIPDDGLQGVVAVLVGEFLAASWTNAEVDAGAGLPLARLARECLERGFVGLEALSGFPSTVGGAVVMNAGCYGVEIKDHLETVNVVWPSGDRETLEVEELEASYRTTRLQGAGAIVTRARFALTRGDPQQARQRLAELNRRRKASMPRGRPNAGSVFRNPTGDYAGRLIEACELKGLRVGGAEISREHANVVVNTGEARARDVLELMAIAYRKVRDRFAVELQPELVLTGSLAESWSRHVSSSEHS